MEQLEIMNAEWQEVKEKIRCDLMGIKNSFVRIGYMLRRIEDSKLYEKDGYKNLIEFADKEYGLGATIVSRFKAINETYSIDGYSETLRSEFVEFKRSQLEEMLTLSESDRQMIEPETPRACIRELKQFNKQEEIESEDNIQYLVEEFYKVHKDELNQVYIEHANENSIKEIVNPAGSKSFRKGMYFMMMQESKIQVKKFNQLPQEMSWKEFYDLTMDIFQEGDGNETWQSYYGVEEEKKEDIKLLNIAPAQKTPSKKEVKKEVVIESEEPVQEIQKIQEVQEIEKVQEIEDLQDDIESEETYVEVEILEKPFGSRKDYLDTLTENEMAIYIVTEYKAERLLIDTLSSVTDLEEWLRFKVDDMGRMMNQI